MARIVLTDGSGRWFDDKSAQSWEEETRWDGHNHVSKVAGGKFDHEKLYRTKGGIYVIHHWSRWQGSIDSYEGVTPEVAARWLSENGRDVEGAGTEVETAHAALEIL
jgi:hypothetical protein